MDATGVTGFGAQGPGTLHTNMNVGSGRAGQTYKLGLDNKGRVVHIYSNGQHVTIVPHGQPKQALALTLFHQEDQQARHAAALQDVARQLMAQSQMAAAAHGLPA